MYEFTEIGHAPIEELRQGAVTFDPNSPESCKAFRRLVIAAETVLKQTYKCAALTAKRAETLEEEAEVWRIMSEFAESLVVALGDPKDANPDCGTPELSNLALAYRQAALERLGLLTESTACQTLQMPEGLFPPRT